tara:strand:+ start:250 stop:843 length:594 start_codon:yes stop_codon:yes gene_type:complete
MNYQGEGSMLRNFDNTWFAWKWRIVGAFIGLIMAAPLFIMAAKADGVVSSEQVYGEVWHVERLLVNINKNERQQRCSIRKVPVYGEHYQQHGQGSSTGDLLGAMVLGGIFGHALSGNNDGAAAGAVLGALVQNDRSNNQSTGRFIAGYEDREVCDIVSVPTTVKAYRYVVHWKKRNMRGHFFSKKERFVGEIVKVSR